MTILRTSLKQDIPLKPNVSLQNEVSITAVKITPNPNIDSMKPTERKCYFDYEHPMSHPLRVHKNYSQVTN